jgi:hypothetical protein
VLDGDKDAFLVKHGPVTPDNVVYPFLEVGFQMQEIHVTLHDFLVLLGNKRRVIKRVYRRRKVRLGVPKLAQDGSAVNIMKHVVVVIGHIGEAAII